MILLFIMRPLLRGRNILFLFALYLLPAFFAAADSETAVLFIQSDPINADILVDETPLLQKTPALLVNLQGGEHSIGIRKDGFAPSDFVINLSAGETRVFETELSSGTIIAGFPDTKNRILQTAGETMLAPAVRLTEGSYRFDKADNNLFITPLYPKQNLLTINGTLFLTALTATIATALDKDQKIFLPRSEILMITGTAASVLALTELILLIDKRIFNLDFELFNADLSISDTEAEQLFDRAQAALSIGRIEEALSGFSELVGSYPDYSGFPEALYKISRLHLISGDTNLAISELNIIINEFPDSGIYDKACQTLSLLYFNSGETEKSREAAERMVYYDPIFAGTEEEIELIGIDRVIENWAGNPERQAE